MNDDNAFVRSVKEAYPRAYGEGTPRQIKAIEKCQQRFWDQVKRSNGCWQWTGCLSEGYGIFSINRCLIKAHSFSCFLSGRPPVSGMILHHTCENTRCVNPDHLQHTTQSDHALHLTPTFRACSRARQTKCQNGHPFTAENTILTSNGHRRCRLCKQEFDTAARQKNLDKIRQKDRERYLRRKEKKDAERKRIGAQDHTGSKVDVSEKLCEEIV